MAIRTQIKEGKKLFQVYVNLRSQKDPQIRVQKTVSGLESKAAARREELKVHQELAKKIAFLEGRSGTWEFIIEKWKSEAQSGNLGEYNPSTIMDHVASLRKWTGHWLGRIASEIGRAEGRSILNKLDEEGLSLSYQKKIKNIINMIYNFGIEEGLILGVRYSPVYGLKIKGEKKEKVPDILTIVEIKKFLLEAKRSQHPWYPIWATALLTGLRNGELYALEWNDVDFDGFLIRVSKSFNKRTREIKSTKAGYWRNIPMSPDLKSLFLELRMKSKSNLVLPRIREWDTGNQSRVLKSFLQGVGLPSVKFHALRSCFATQLLAKGTPSAVVMKICGWRDLNTMEYYVRLAGIEEKGATDHLKLLPNRKEVFSNLVELFV